MKYLLVFILFIFCQCHQKKEDNKNHPLEYHRRDRKPQKG